jgi:hypothetical protein
MSDPLWYLFIHQLPAKPLYLRAQIRQHLAKVGSVALKSSVYILPYSDVSLESFLRIAEEAVAGGGEAHLCAATFCDQPSNEEIEERFRQQRTADYAAIAEPLRQLLLQIRQPGAVVPGEDDLLARLRRLEKRFDAVAAIDFFGAPGRAEAEALIHRIEQRLHPGEDHPEAFGPRRELSALAGHVWVTRKGVHVDRIASAWLIRRFIDPTARFRFADSQSPDAAPGELRFDTMGGEFTHEGDRCTFETLVARLGLHDPAVLQIAEIVHDIDIKDGKFGRPDAPGVLQIVTGLALAHPDDLVRLDRGFALFDDLYESFRPRTPKLPVQANEPHPGTGRTTSKPRRNL